MNRFARYIPPALLFISLMLVYLSSMASGLTWANDGSDGGDLITAAATGGIPHPTGYPSYLLLARVFQLLPIGSLAFRTNLMSAVCAAAAAVFVYDLVVRFLFSESGKLNWLTGLASAYAFGLSPLLWSQAVVTEVYALHALFVAIILYLSLQDRPFLFPKKYMDRFLGFIFGLAMGNHVTTILLLPVIFFQLIPFRNPDVDDKFINEKYKIAVHSFLRRITWIGLGLSVYLILPLRALSLPPVNWGNPATLNGFLWLVSGKLYQSELFTVTWPFVWSRMQAVAGLLIEQFGIPGMTLGLIGLVVFYKPTTLFRNTIWIFLVFIVFSVIYATYDSFMYLIPAFLCFAIWIGIGLNGIMDMFLKHSFQLRVVIGSIFIIYIFILAGRTWPQVDASQDLRAEEFGKRMLDEAPVGAIIFAKGDKAIFTMWYFHYALGQRPDLAVVVVDLLQFDWYQETLQINYPNLVLPGPFPFAERMAAINSERPACHISYEKFVSFYCLPPHTSETR